MNRYAIVLLALLLAACGKDPIAPPPPPVIIKLIMAQDTGFWRGGAVRLSSLIRGAVTNHGDTVAAPAVTWTLPAGFTRQGDSVLATREVRGELRASFASAADSTATVSVSDLSTRGPWVSESRCYNSPNGMRGVENPPIGVDSAIRTQSNGAAEYTTGDGMWSGEIKLRISIDEQVIRFWKDGVVDTVLSRTAIVASQDTLQLALGSNIGPAVPWMKRTSDSPIVYRLESPGTCSSDWHGGGSAYELRAP